MNDEKRVFDWLIAQRERELNKYKKALQMIEEYTKRNRHHHTIRPVYELARSALSASKEDTKKGHQEWDL